MLKNLVSTPFLIVLIVLLVLGCVGTVLLRNLLPADFLNIVSGDATINNRTTVILDRVQALSSLTTTRYNYSMLVTSEREMPPLLAGLYGESLSLVAVGHVNAGIDLSLLESKDIVEQPTGLLIITLPPPTLQDCFLNEQQSYVVRRDTGLFASASPELDNSARRFAIQQFSTAALEGGILAEAQTQATVAIAELISAVGIESVQVNTTPPNLDAPLPATCG